MIKAVLFDLDGTLLPLDMEEFLKNYLDLLSKRMEAYLEPKTFIKELMAATEAMIKDENHKLSNAQVFTKSFFSATGLDEDELMPLFEEFYLNEYCSLGKNVRPMPVAKQIIDILKTKGYLLVLATNPLFPRIAIEERLRWADIAPEVFTLITSYEIMHAAKPNPQYYKEIAGKIQVAPEQCLMVGNDVEEDLVAKTIGMKTYLVNNFMLNRRNLPIITDYQGDLHSLLDFVRSL